MKLTGSAGEVTGHSHQIHPNLWQAQWLLEEKNADIDGFDPGDFEGERDAPKKEDIYLLKMTCPSTGFIHALRVPPNMTSAKEAIRWVNWDIDSEEFSVQT